MTKTTKEKTDNTFLPIISGVFVITLLVIFKNFLSPYLWFDEASQFWISKGLSPEAIPMSTTGGVAQVIESNKYFNLDPGGFGILLHFWSYVSNHHIWLRLLPFLFFIGVIWSFMYLSWLWIKNINVALLMGFIPILTPVVLSMGFEVRAFSMESLGTIISVIGLEKLKSRLTDKHLFIWSCIFSFFITSRYAEIVVVFIASLYVLFLIFSSASTLKQKLVSLTIYSLPLIATLAYIYFFALTYQNKNVETLNYLRYLSNDKSLLTEPKNFLFICLIGLLIVVFFLKEKYPVIKKYEMLLFMSISVNVLFIILSFLGKHPWEPFTKRCISLFLLAILCVTAFLGELIKVWLKNPEILKYGFIILLLIATLYMRKNTLYIRQTEHNKYFNYEKTNVAKFNAVYVDRWESPSLRYLFEYGALSAEKGKAYPSHFTFARIGSTYNSHITFGDGKEMLHDFYMRQPKMNDLLKYDLLIAPELSTYGNNDKWKLIEGTEIFYIKK